MAAAYVNKLTGEVLFDPFLARQQNAEIPGVIRKQLEEEESSTPKPQSQLLPLFIHFKPPPQSAVPRAEEIVRQFASIDGFSRALPPVNSLNPLGPNYLEALHGSDEDKKKCGFVVAHNPNQYSFGTARADASAYTAMLYLVAQSSTPEEMKKEMKQFIEFSNTEYYGGGTLAGLMNRLKQRLVRHRPLATFVSPTPANIQEEVSKIKSVLKFDVSKIKSLVGKTPDRVGIKINAKAAAGSPFLDPSCPIKRVEVAVANQALLLFSKAQEGYKSLRKYLAERREFLLVQLKNKRERMARTSYHSKVRPYYVYPGAIRLLYTCVVDCVYAPLLLRFDQDPDSSSALGFSWASGGAGKMVSWFYHHQGPGVYAIIYGDDIWILFVNKDFRCLVAVDLSSLDMTIGPDTIRYHHELYYPMIKSSLDPAWSVINIQYLSNTVESEVLVYKNAVFHKVTGLNSGVNGTTIIDITAAARVVGHVRDLFQATPVSDLASTKKFMDVASKSVKSKMGFEMKVDDMIYDVLPPRSSFVSTEGRFLGMRIVSRDYSVAGEKKQFFLPEPNFNGLASTLVHFEVTGVDRHNLAAVGGVKMVRMFGILVSGGWLSKTLFAVVQRMWDEAVRQGWSPFNISTEMETLELLDDVRDAGIEYLSKIKKEKKLVLPPESWFIKLYTGITVDVLVKTQDHFDDIDLGFESVAEQLLGISVVEQKHEEKHPALPDAEVVNDPYESVMNDSLRQVEESVGILHSHPPSLEIPAVVQVSSTALQPTAVGKKVLGLAKNPVLKRIKDARWMNDMYRRKAKLESKSATRSARNKRRGKSDNDDEFLIDINEEIDEIEEAIENEQEQWNDEERLMRERIAEELLKRKSEEEEKDFVRKPWSDWDDDEYDYFDTHFGDAYGGYAKGFAVNAT